MVTWVWLLTGCVRYALVCPETAATGEIFTIVVQQKNRQKVDEQLSWSFDSSLDSEILDDTRGDFYAYSPGRYSFTVTGKDSRRHASCSVEVVGDEVTEPPEFGTPSEPTTPTADDPPDLVAVGPITFQQGCVGDAKSCESWELPLRSVSLSPFSIERTEVSVAAYRACIEAGRCTEPGDAGGGGEPGDTGVVDSGCNEWDDPSLDDHPINCVTWEQAADYCDWRGLRLPTEAEWEAAARGSDDTRRFPWGDDFATCELANTFDTTIGRFCIGTTAPVDAHPSGQSPFGALNMAGNVGEWVADWFDPTYYATAPDTDPPGPEMMTLRLTRGGEFDRVSRFAFTSSRNAIDPDAAQPNIGFRCARSD